MTNSFVQRIADGELSYMEDEIPTLNCGGCGLVALTIGEQLERQGVDFEIVYYSVYLDHGTASDEEIMEIVQAGEHCPNTHVLVRAEGITFDSNGDFEYSDGYFGDEYGTSSLETLRAMVHDRPDAWNYMFNRDRHEEQVKEMIQELFDTELEVAA